jgi:hypothetical protein
MSSLPDFLLWSTIILGIWAAVGPIVGIRYGQELAKRWQKEQWLRENRKQECRELLDAMHQYSVVTSLTPNNTKEVAGNLIAVFGSRIFIADDLRKSKLAERWPSIFHNRDRSEAERLEFLKQREEMTEEVRKFART